MLARLEGIDGVEAVEIDHSGELLRLSLTSDRALEEAVRLLRELGYRADRLGQAPGVERWYGRDAVRELSREEGGIIAKRVVPAFARRHGLAPSVADALTHRVTQTLYRQFAAHKIEAGAVPGALRRGAIAAVEKAVRGLLDADGARDLAAALSADLERTRSSEQ